MNQVAGTKPGARTDRSLDHGRAWVDMLLAGLSMFTVFATAYSFGTFVKPMANEFNSDRGGIALVFGITAFLYFVLGAVTGPLVHRVGPKRMVAFGGTIQVVGMLLTSRVSSLHQAYFTYGIGVGIGVACAYVPLVAVVGGWFQKRRATAVGLAVSGIGLSSLIAPPIAARLIRAYGWRDSYVIMAIATAVLLGLVVAFVRTPPGFSDKPKLTLGSAIRSRQFKLSYFGVLMCSIPLFSVFVNIVPYAEDHGFDKVTAATLVSWIGVASIVGRVGLAALAQRVGTGPVYAASFAGMTITQLLWLVAGSSYAALALFAVIFGVSYGGFISLSPALLAELFGSEQLGGLTGVNYSAAGIGALIGPTVGAALVDRTDGYGTTILAGLAAGTIGTTAIVLLVLGQRTSARGARGRP